MALIVPKQCEPGRCPGSVERVQKIVSVDSDRVGVADPALLVFVTRVRRFREQNEARHDGHAVVFFSRVREQDDLPVPRLRDLARTPEILPRIPRLNLGILVIT